VNEANGTALNPGTYYSADMASDPAPDGIPVATIEPGDAPLNSSGAAVVQLTTSVPSGTQTVMDFGTTVYDTGNFTSAFSSNKLSITIPGIYKVAVAIDIQGESILGSAYACDLYIGHNGGGGPGSPGQQGQTFELIPANISGGGTLYTTVKCDDLYNCVAGDYFKTSILQVSGSTFVVAGIFSIVGPL
jgi:hypothetical protein